MDSRTNKLVSLCPPRAIYTPTTFLLRSVYVPSAFRPRAFVALLIPPSEFECVRSTTCVPRHALQCVRHTRAVRVCAFHYLCVRFTTCVPMHAFHHLRSTTCVPSGAFRCVVRMDAFHDMRSTTILPMRSAICVPLYAFHWMRSTICAPMLLRSTMCVLFQNPNVLDPRTNQNTSGPICIGSSYKLKIVSEDEQVKANLN